MDAAVLQAVLQAQNAAFKEMLSEFKGELSKGETAKRKDKWGSALVTAIAEFGGTGFADWKIRTESAARAKHKGFLQFLRWAESVDVQGSIDYSLLEVTTSEKLSCRLRGMWSLVLRCFRCQAQRRGI